MVRICLDPGVVSQVSLRSKKQRLNPYLWVISCAVVNITQEFFRVFFWIQGQISRGQQSKNSKVSCEPRVCKHEDSTDRNVRRENRLHL